MQLVAENQNEVDLVSILKEQKDKGELVSIITFAGPQKLVTGAVLALHKDFLEQFRSWENVQIREQSLHPKWGFSGIRIQESDRHVIPIYDRDESNDEGRFLAIPPFSIEEVKAEVKFAKESRRKIWITVEAL